MPGYVPVRCDSFSGSVNVSSNKVSVVVVIDPKEHVQGICFREISCPVCLKLVELVSSKS